MPSKPRSANPELFYVGIKGSVLAIRKWDGGIAWSVKLSRGSSFVPIVQEGDRVFVASGGEVSCLDGATGKLLWHNPLRGFGTGYAALAGGGFPISAAASEQAAAAMGAAAAGAASAG